MSKKLLEQFPEIVANGRKTSAQIGKAPIIFSFFSGAGFLDLGFEDAGYVIGYVNEVHKPFLDAYKYSRQKMGAMPPIHGYFEGDIECCFSSDEAKRLTELVKTAKKEVGSTLSQTLFNYGVESDALAKTEIQIKNEK